MRRSFSGLMAASWLSLLALVWLRVTSTGRAQDRPSLGQIEMDISDLMDLIVPVAAVMPFAGSATAVPDGWLLCDGSEVSRTLCSIADQLRLRRRRQDLQPAGLPGSLPARSG